MHVGVMGAGSIGCYVGGMILTTGEAVVTFVGRKRLHDEVAEHGLQVQNYDDPPHVIARDKIRYELDADCLRECEVVLVCVKSAATEDAAKKMNEVLGSDAIVVSMQNGVRNPKTLRAHLGDRTVLPGIVGFNVVSRGGGLFQRTMSGPLAIEACADPRWRAVASALRASGLHVEEPVDISADQWTKLLINLNNSVSALSGAPTQQLLLDSGYRRVIAGLVAEGVRVLRAAGIQPAKLRGVPIGLLPRVLRLPSFLVRVLTRTKIDPEARSSMWEDLSKGRLTEVDYLNGEIVSLAEKHSANAPLNRRVVELVHEAERAAAGPPNMSAAALWGELNRS